MPVNSIKTIALWLCFLPNSVWANTLENFPVPPHAKVWWVSSGNLHNGHELFIKKFKSQQTPEEIADFYRRHWQSGSDSLGYTQNKQGEWLIIGRLKPTHQWVVQIKAKGTGRGSEGFISSMKLDSNTLSRAGVRKKTFTEPVGGGDLLSSTESYEPRIARTQIHLYPNRPVQVAKKHINYMASDGWSFQDEYEHQGAVIQRFDRTGRQIDVALVAHRGTHTLVFLNEVIIHGK